MAQKKSGPQQRERWNSVEQKREIVSGTKAGKKRSRLPVGHPMRTHDIHGFRGTTRKKKMIEIVADED